MSTIKLVLAVKNSRRVIALLTTGAFLLVPAGLLVSYALAAIEPAGTRAAARAAGLDSLATVQTPEVANLMEFLKPGPVARRTAIVLGKALFWDMQAGSDGQACASCHFHAGSDPRARNQLTPGLRNVDPALQGVFNPAASGNIGPSGFSGGPDYTLGPADFPFHQLVDPENNNFNTRTVTFDTDDVVSSMGAFAADFIQVVPGQSNDVGNPKVDPIFNLHTPSASLITYNVRRVEPRNTPTVINTVFNHSNFWDGRAHNFFNGVSVIGPLDPAAGIWVNNGRSGATPVQQTVRIPNSSLASQAVGPPTSDLEMSFFDRPFPLIGRKLLSLRPLGLQRVHPNDSVLGPLSLARSGQNGIIRPYATLIAEAFRPKYWSGGNVNIGGKTFTQMEANFSLFWGLAIQLYETTLVSDRTRFDSFMEGMDAALNQAELQGLLVFLNQGPGRNPPEVDAAIAAAGVPIGVGNCVACHRGPEFTSAAFTSLASTGPLELIEQEDTPVLLAGGFLQVSTEQGLEDAGFSNIGVRPTNDDLGRGGKENNFPLSFTRQALDPTLNFLLEAVGAELSCDPTLTPPVVGACPTRTQVDGAFKIPGLRNVELTGPYFHNGGQATLSQVVQFYDRQSDFGDVNIQQLDGEIALIDLDEPDEESLVAFLLSLTDPRVRWERAPFDHPQLFVPNGGTFGTEEPRILVPAVGADGRPAALGPLGTFLGLAP